jgi:hypothetical protein
MANNFLKNMKDALERGEPNEATKLVNDIDKLAENKNVNQTLEEFNTELIEHGDKPDKDVKASLKLPEIPKEELKKNSKEGDTEISKEEMEKANADYEASMAEINKENDFLMKLAAIENYRTNIQNTKNEYDDMISEMEDTLNDLTEEFEKEYGKIEDYHK